MMTRLPSSNDSRLPLRLSKPKIVAATFFILAFVMNYYCPQCFCDEIAPLVPSYRWMRPSRASKRLDQVDSTLYSLVESLLTPVMSRSSQNGWKGYVFVDPLYKNPSSGDQSFSRIFKSSLVPPSYLPSESAPVPYVVQAPPDMFMESSNQYISTVPRSTWGQPEPNYDEEEEKEKAAGLPVARGYANSKVTTTTSKSTPAISIGHSPGTTSIRLGKAQITFKKDSISFGPAESVVSASASASRKASPLSTAGGSQLAKRNKALSSSVAESRLRVANRKSVAYEHPEEGEWEDEENDKFAEESDQHGSQDDSKETDDEIHRSPVYAAAASGYYHSYKPYQSGRILTSQGHRSKKRGEYLPPPLYPYPSEDSKSKSTSRPVKAVPKSAIKSSRPSSGSKLLPFGDEDQDYELSTKVKSAKKVNRHLDDDYEDEEAEKRLEMAIRANQKSAKSGKHVNDEGRGSRRFVDKLSDLRDAKKREKKTISEDEEVSDETGEPFEEVTSKRPKKRPLNLRDAIEVAIEDGMDEKVERNHKRKSKVSKSVSGSNSPKSTEARKDKDSRTVPDESEDTGRIETDIDDEEKSSNVSGEGQQSRNLQSPKQTGRRRDKQNRKARDQNKSSNENRKRSELSEEVIDSPELLGAKEPESVYFGTSHSGFVRESKDSEDNSTRVEPEVINLNSGFKEEGPFEDTILTLKVPPEGQSARPYEKVGNVYHIRLTSRVASIQDQSSKAKGTGKSLNAEDAESPKREEINNHDDEIKRHKMMDHLLHMMQETLLDIQNKSQSFTPCPPTSLSSSIQAKSNAQPIENPRVEIADFNTKSGDIKLKIAFPEHLSDSGFSISDLANGKNSSALKSILREMTRAISNKMKAHSASKEDSPEKLLPDIYSVPKGDSAKKMVSKNVSETLDIKMDENSGLKYEEIDDKIDPEFNNSTSFLMLSPEFSSLNNHSDDGIKPKTTSPPGSEDVPIIVVLLPPDDLASS